MTHRPQYWNGNKLYFEEEVRFAFFLGGLAGALFTCVAAYVWSFYL